MLEGFLGDELELISWRLCGGHGDDTAHVLSAPVVFSDAFDFAPLYGRLRRRGKRLDDLPIGAFLVLEGFLGDELKPIS